MRDYTFPFLFLGGFQVIITETVVMEGIKNCSQDSFLCKSRRRPTDENVSRIISQYFEHYPQTHKNLYRN